AGIKELYDLNPYTKEFDAQVVSCNLNNDVYEIVLDRTAFYPEGGGQPADRGTLGTVNVLDVQEKAETIIHYCDAPLAEGTQVHGAIDWNRRFDLMQNHSGEHIVSGLIHQLYGYENVGFHMGDVIQIDFNGPLNEEQLKDIETRANRIVMNNEEIIALFPDGEELKTLEFRSKKELKGVVRIIEIPGADVCACCGTHVKRTGEIGLIKLLGWQKHKKGVRVEMLSGMRALAYVQAAMAENHKVSVALSAKELETSSAVDALIRTSIRKDVRIREISSRLLDYRLAEMKEGMKLAADYVDPLDRTVLIRYGNAMAEKAEIAAVLSGSEDHWNYHIISRTVPLKAKAAVLNAKLNGRGGGSEEMIQGSFNASKEEIDAVLAEVLG
ncbi:MAG: alanyl-tRNA editing protein, partial [Erysipelotrichaceae bacterium]|nr:alanyl-tRNA editing protein [Erysipelotrichaceae bacterium]